MNQLNKDSNKVDFSFCIEKEISRHYLYNVADNIIETASYDGLKHELVIEDLTLWFQKIHGQQLSDIQKYYIYKKIMDNYNFVKDISLTENLIKELVTGYKLIHYLDQKIEHYQIQRKIKYPILNFVLLGMKQNYNIFLIELDPKSIDLFNMNK